MTALQIATIKAAAPPTAEFGGIMNDSFFASGGMAVSAQDWNISCLRLVKFQLDQCPKNCFLSAIGLGMVSVYLDFILLPILAVFLLLMIYGRLQLMRTRSFSIHIEAQRKGADFITR